MKDMDFIATAVFILMVFVSSYFALRKYSAIRRNILLGRDENLSDNKPLRWKNMILFALGQKKMFRNFIPAFFHLFIYVSFVIVNIEVLEILTDGIFGTHRFFAPFLGAFYSFLISFIEILSALALVATLIFLVRRNIIKVKRFTQPELKGWPFKDANFILFMELILVTAILTMNACYYQLQLRNAEHYPYAGVFFVSQYTSNYLKYIGTEHLILMERTAWWLHIAGILFFLNYIPYSKHLHIFLAFPNAYYMRFKKKGKIENMPVVMHEVTQIINPQAEIKIAGDVPKSFGAKDITDLTWKHLLDAYACTECGRCTAACPANQTGKKLSPRKIMMDTRDRAEEVGKNILQHGKDFKDNKSLLHDYITEEELRACTTCNACVEECPVNIDPLSIIVELRRYLIMEQSNSPAEWNLMFSNLENNQAPWKFNPEERIKWVEAMREQISYPE